MEASAAFLVLGLGEGKGKGVTDGGGREGMRGERGGGCDVVWCFPLASIAFWHSMEFFVTWHLALGDLSDGSEGVIWTWGVHISVVLAVQFIYYVYHRNQS